jgi:hypothetical protein
MRMRWLGGSLCARRLRRLQPIRAGLERLEARLVQSASPTAAGSVGLGPGVIERPSFTVISTTGGGLGMAGSHQVGILPAQWGGASPTGDTPAQIQTAYGINAITFGSILGNGAGQTIAIVDAYDDPNLVDSAAPNYGSSDLAEFDQGFGLPDPPSFTKVNQAGAASPLPGLDPAGRGNPAGDWEVEEALDVEWAHAIAPEASIVLVECSSDSGAAMYIGVQAAAALPNVSVVSMSWGSSEFSDELSYDNDFTTPAGHQGVTFVASTGDEGSPGNYPAYSPNVVAAGGTNLVLNSDGSYQSESAWSGSGGGTSTFEREPAYQVGVQSTGKRTISDMAFDADPSTGVAVYDSYNNPSSSPWEEVGGTSVAAPSLAALIAIADQGRVAAGYATLDGSTQTLPALYSLPASDWNAITSGGNGAFQAGAGYNEVTGLGTPKANLMVPDLAAYGMVSGLAVAAQPSGVTAGSPFNLRVEANNKSGGLAAGFDGTMTIALANNPGGSTLGGTLTVTAENGEATFPNLWLNHTGGGYTFVVTAGLSVSMTTGPVVVAPAAPARAVIFDEPPAALAVDAPIGLGVVVVDAFGNVVSQYSGDLTVSPERDPGGAWLEGTLTIAVSQGYAEFSDLTVTRAGMGRVIKVRGAGLAPVKTTAFDVTPRGRPSLRSNARLPRGMAAAIKIGRGRPARRA